MFFLLKAVVVNVILCFISRLVLTSDVISDIPLHLFDLVFDYLCIYHLLFSGLWHRLPSSVLHYLFSFLMNCPRVRHIRIITTHYTDTRARDFSVQLYTTAHLYRRNHINIARRPVVVPIAVVQRIRKLIKHLRNNFEPCFRSPGHLDGLLIFHVSNSRILNFRAIRFAT